MALEPFSDRFPGRFFNVGVAEQNMIGVATGLAEAGRIPYAYSIIPFAALRSYEFIRNGPLFHGLPVRVVGVGAGVDYANNGPSHHGLEDVAVMRCLPGMTVVAPADPAQTRTAMRATWDLPGPVYYRLSKDEKIAVPPLEGRFELGRLQTVRAGSDLLVLAMGNIASEALAACERLAADGISAGLAVISSLNPSPVADLAARLARVPLVLTVETHYLAGGIGSLAAEVIAEHGLRCRLHRCGVAEIPTGPIGSQQYFYDRFGLSAEKLAARARQALHAVVADPVAKDR
jgi:transketolase